MVGTRERSGGWWWMVALASVWACPLWAAETPATAPAKHALRYKFRAGEVLRWEVVHRSRIETTVSGTTITSDAHTSSTKVWRVKAVQPNGNATLEYLVDNVDMRQKMTGRMEVRYNSRTDKTPPRGFETVAKSIGVPLSNITLDGRGAVVKREQLVARPQSEEGHVTMLLPENPIAVGERWSIPSEIDVPQENGRVRKVKAQQNFTLQAVHEGVATIRVETQVLSPIDDPAVEAQLIQRESTGTVRFNLVEGRIVGQQMEVDRRVLGFRGPASSLQCRTLFSEKLLAEETKTAAAAPQAADTQAGSPVAPTTTSGDAPPRSAAAPQASSVAETKDVQRK